jgi:hypothetical protein
MWLIMLFGVLMMILSLLMIINPQAFSRGIVSFSKQSYFHAFEVLSRLFFGIAFVYYAPLSLAPTLNATLGYLMIFVVILILIIGADKHRKFALWSAKKFCPIFRFAGVFSAFFGSYIIFTAT